MGEKISSLKKSYKSIKKLIPAQIKFFLTIILTYFVFFLFFVDMVFYLFYDEIVWVLIQIILIKNGGG